MVQDDQERDIQVKNQFTTSSLKALFRYPFQGEAWGSKLLILSLITGAGFFIPILPWLFSAGYSAAVLRQAVAGDLENGLPEWKDWNRLLLDGARLLGISLVITLPLILVYFIGIGFYFVSITGAVNGSSYGNEILPSILAMGGATVLLCVNLFVAVLGALAGVLFMPAVSHMLIQDSFSAVFRIREWWPIFRANLGGFIISFVFYYAMLYVFQMGIAMMIWTLVLCFLVPFVLLAGSAYLSVLWVVMIGRSYDEGRQTLLINRMNSQDAGQAGAAPAL